MQLILMLELNSHFLTQNECVNKMNLFVSGTIDFHIFRRYGIRAS